MDFGLIIHRSPFVAGDRDPLVLSNYIFELLHVNPRVAGFLIQLHPEAHAKKGMGMKMTLYVGPEEEEEREEVEGEEEEDAGGARRKAKPHHPLMITVVCKRHLAIF